MGKRIFLFLVTNIVIVLTLSVLMSVFGIGQYITPYGLDIQALAVLCLVWGMGGSFISLQMSRWVAKKATGVKLIQGQTGQEELDWVYQTVSRLAQQANLPVADKPDSQEICFIPSGNYREFLRDRIEPKPGVFVNKEGKELGKHPGIQFFTVGQRRKLGLQSINGDAMFVLNIDSNTKKITLGAEEDLYEREFLCSGLSFTHDDYEKDELKISARIRYKAKDAPATVSVSNDVGTVCYDVAQRAITPGQPVVFYRDEEMIGGGIIESSVHNTAEGMEESLFSVSSSYSFYYN